MSNWVKTDEVISLAEKVRKECKSGFELDFMNSISSKKYTHYEDTWTLAVVRWLKKEKMSLSDKQFKIYNKIKLIYK